MGSRATTRVTSRVSREAFNVAVDVGRSSVKIVSSEGQNAFPFLVATKKAMTADYYVPNGSIQKVANVDGEFMMFGEEAMLLGDSVIQNTEGEAFRDMAIKATIFSAAYAMLASDDIKQKVNVSINLTFDNHYQKEQYAEALKGKHTVEFLKDDETIEFEIERVFVLYQGFSGLLAVATDPAFNIDPKYLANGVIVDIGRQTIDLLYVERMVVKAGTSKDFGTFKVYEKVVDLLKRKHNIQKEPHEIEDIVSSGKSISNIETGKKLDIQPLLKEAVQYYWKDVLLHFETFLSKRTPDFLLLLGGGALLYGPFFEDKYKLVEIPEDPQFSNGAGMLKFMDKMTAGASA